MNVIDLEILIPASPDFIWRFLGDLSTIPHWQEDVVSVSFLSTQHEGRGTRWRHSTQKGSDVVAQIGAWYDTLGFEYQIVDGAPFGENQGRIKLHEVPEGTLVNWTFQYELDGLLGGIRNAMRLKRNTTNQIQDSLRNLHHLITQESGGISTHEAKASMQDAPDVDERVGYQPRHPSAFHDPALEDLEAAAVDDASATDKQPIAYEFVNEAVPLSAVADTDTKPNPVVLSTVAEISIEDDEEPALEDTKPIELAALLAEPPPEPADLPEPAPVLAPISPEEPDEVPAPPVELPSRREAIDSSHVSVFEIFGLQKPSETGPQMEPSRAIPGDRLTIEPAPPDRSNEYGRSPMEVAAREEPHTVTESRSEALATPYSGIAGLRRKSRRRRTLLRSHN